jgi:uncharacterized membrane protein YhhN
VSPVLSFVVMFLLVATLLWLQTPGAGRRRRWEWVVKPAAALNFIAAALWAGALATPFGRVLLVGLVLAATGDVLLIERRRGAFLAGLIAFLLGHLATGLAFAVRGLDGPAVAIAAVLLGAAAAPVLRWLWPHVERSMRGPVIAYVVVISAMVALAAGAARRDDAWLLLVGAAGFYLSDLAVARDRFVASGFVNRAWGLPLYFFAQLLLATQAGTG